MTNIFEETYNAMQEAKAAYNRAATEESRDAAEAAFREAKDRMAAHGDIAWTIWRAYESSRENENEVINFDDIIPDRDIEALITCMRENGIQTFTYSCRATDAIETLWLFTELGCTIGEMVLVNLRKDPWIDGYDMGHAFRISLNGEDYTERRS